MIIFTETEAYKNDISTLKTYCRENRLRFTAEREKLLQCMYEYEDSFTNKSFLPYLEDKGINKQTFWRNIYLFVKCGILNKKIIESKINPYYEYTLINGL